MKRVLTVGLIVAALLVGVAVSQTEAARWAFGSAPPARPRAAPALTGETTQFVAAALADAAAQIGLATLAVEQASSAGVRQLAREMAADRRDAARQLVELAPGAVAATAQGDDARSLAPLRGVRFDRAYLDRAIQEQQRALDLHVTQTRHAGSLDTAAFVTSRVPELRAQLRELHRHAALAAVAPSTASSAQQGVAKRAPRKAASGPVAAPPTTVGADAAALNRRELGRLRIETPAGRATTARP